MAPWTGRPSGRRLGNASIALGYVTRETLRELFCDWIREAVPDLCRWAGGDFERHDCLGVFSEVEMGEVPVMRLVIEGPPTLEERRAITRT